MGCKVYIQHYACGNYGELITCIHTKGDCRECSNRMKSYVEEKEVTKDELLNLINEASDWIDISTVKI